VFGGESIIADRASQRCGKQAYLHARDLSAASLNGASYCGILGVAGKERLSIYVVDGGSLEKGKQVVVEGLLRYNAFKSAILPDGPRYSDDDYGK
jgi:hypothetical protein